MFRCLIHYIFVKLSHLSITTSIKNSNNLCIYILKLKLKPKISKKLIIDNFGFNFYILINLL